jgi:FkbM family methyltransferase
VYNIQQLIKKLPEKPIIIDIGANVGYFNILLLSKLKAATIYAYEPIPANVQYFKNVIEQNTALQKSVSLLQAAVTGIHKESLDLFMEATDDNQVVASVFADFNIHNTKKITVPCISLTDIILNNQLNIIDLLKIDCEGSEYDILYNTSPDLLLKVKHIAVEVHDVDTNKNNFTALKAYLEQIGFDLSFAPINDFCYAVDCVNKTIITCNK